MIKYLKLLMLVAISLLACAALADTGPSPLPVAAVAPVSVSWKVILAAIPALAVAVLDFIFAVNSGAKSNGILHWVYLMAGGKENPPA